jgi:hypothetical protein
MAPQANDSLTPIPGVPSAATGARPQVQHPLKVAHAAMLAGLGRLVVPVIPVFPEPVDFEAVAEHMRDVAEIVDDYMTAIGDHVAENASVKIDLSLFAAPLLESIDGNATFEIERVAEILRADLYGECA